jgi:putative hemolysin
MSDPPSACSVPVNANGGCSLQAAWGAVHPVAPPRARVGQCSSASRQPGRAGGVQGFITATARGALRICQLPARVRLDAPWPLRKVPLRATPHRLAFYAEARLYALLTSRQARARHGRPKP